MSNTMQIVKKWRRKRFTKNFIRIATTKHKNGEISGEQYQQALRAAQKPAIMQDAMDQLFGKEGPLGGIKDWDWDKIIHFMTEVFIPILKIVLPLLLAAESQND